ncbi:MAG TPA: AAA family ATPase, partial [Vicinamibacterales bacterium]
GKTTLMQAFAGTVAREPNARICSGQCLPQYGMSEAYLPVLDAIRQLCQEDPQAIDVLRLHAPMWLMQLPSLMTAADREQFLRDGASTTPERMLREMGAALDALTAHAPLVLVLEDLHWSDYSTLDLISYVARRRRAAHLMLVGTYRPAELIVSGHPLKSVKQELRAKQQCDELQLESLTGGLIARHLAERFPGHQFPAALGVLIHERTEGNPLFMVNSIDHLVAEGLIGSDEHGWRLTAPIETIELGVPDSIRQLIETQFDRLHPDDQRLLEAASVAGTEFSAAAIAAALGDGVADVETRCEQLSRRHQFIRNCGTQVLPNGTSASRFGFVHAVYQQVFYERMLPSMRVQVHRGIAEGGEEVYGERTSEIAAELAMHFEKAADHPRAARYLHRAAVIALGRSAYREAIALSRRGLELLDSLPDGDEKSRHRLLLHMTLGVPLIATEGYGSSHVGTVYREARRLSEKLGHMSELSHVLWGLWTFHTLRGELSTALGIAGEFLELAERAGAPGLALRGHWTMQITCTHQGRFRPALEHFEKALSLHETDQQRDDVLADALDAGIAMRGFAGWSLWFTGQADRALVPVREAVALARRRSEPHGLAHALVFAAIVHQLRRERHDAQQYAEEAMLVSDGHGFALYRAMAQIIGGWALIGRTTDDRAANEIREGLSAWHNTGARLMRPHFVALLVEALPEGPGDAGIELLDEALALSESTGECYYQAELYRLKGERLARRHPRDFAAAVECFEQSLAVARQQGGVSLELRAARSLSEARARFPHSTAARTLVSIE